VTAAAADGLRLYLVDPSASGCTVTVRNGLDLVRRFAAVSFDAVAAGSSLATDTDGDADGVEWLAQVAAVLQCAEMAGAAARCFEFTVEYMSQRYSFGRPLASYQALKHRFADQKVHLECCHAIADAAVRAVGERAPDAQRLASAAKAFVAARAPEVIHECVQMHGGIGVTWEHDLHLFLRRTTVDAGLMGTTDEHRRRVGEFVVAHAGSGAIE
jgi:alkylation response protein AidB-like acyl-CoA dehydrogenase